MRVVTIFEKIIIKLYIKRRSKEMSETPKDKNKKVDMSSVMDKIVEDTIGHIEVSKPTPISKNQKNKRVTKKSNNQSSNDIKLPTKKQVEMDKDIEIKKPTPKAQSKKEVELFFPTEKPVKKAQSSKQQSTKAKTQPKQAKATPTKQAKAPAKKATAQPVKQTKATPAKKTTKAQPAKSTNVASKPTAKNTKSQSKQTKAQGSKAQGSKAQGQKTQGQKTQGSKTQGQKAQGSKTQGQKTQAPKAQVQVAPVEAPPKKKHTLRNIVLSLFGMVLLGAVGVYGYFAYYYRDKFIPGTYINEIDAHELNAKQVEDQIRNRVEDYAIEIDFRDGKKGIISGKDIDYAFVSDGGVERILQEQNWLMWIAGHFEIYKHEVSESITFDEAKLEKEYKALPETQRGNQDKPEDAYVFYQNKNWEIIPEIEGTTIDNSILYPEVAKVIHASARACSAEEVESYMTPRVRKGDSKLIAEADRLNQLVGASITYKLPQGDEVLDGNMLKLWLKKDANGRYTKDEEVFNGHIESYVESLAEATDTLGKPHKFKMTGGQETTVESKTFGWQVDVDTETEKLKEDLANNAKIEREPEYAKRAASMDNNGFGNTYIEVNLSLQHMYVYRDGRLVLESDLVSGRMTGSRWTPPGIFRLTGKQKHKVLRGPLQPDGTYEWESPVTYWMPFNRGIGFHDATWRGSFGGSIYNYSGSHGCINMPYKKAQALYDIIDKDFVIVCFYPEDYTVRRG